jgi:hypothetical protein
MTRQPPETLTEKAARLLLAGRLKVVDVTGESILARVQGDSGPHRCGYAKRGGWWCDCAARQRAGRGRACSHLLALQLVTGPSSRQQRKAAAS